ncbi:MAG: dihydroneopterin aldolase [Zoogloeaceae bacterium]|jgi:dihydroneopterin aldolase|nr:dihydroneopterin aldolase [Zoogloeaceae bacterium]
MDTIFIDELSLDAWVGVYPRETALSQKVLLNLEIGIPAAAASSDDIRDTVDYARLTVRLRKALSERRFNLLEALAGFVANLILEEFPALKARVTVAKPGVIREARRVSVTIEREKV